MPGDVEGFGEDGVDLLCHHLRFTRGRFGGVGQIGQQDDELVTAQACDHVLVTQQRLQPTGRLDQHRIPDRMAQRVVDIFEVIEIEEKHAGDDAVMAKPAHLLLDLLHQVQPVGDPGQGVIVGLMADLLLIFHLCGDILDDPRKLRPDPDAPWGKTVTPHILS